MNNSNPLYRAPGDGSAAYGDLARRLEAEISAGNVELPVLPEVALRVQKLVGDDAPLDRIVAVIEQEPAYATALMRYANSVAFAGLREVTELRQAVSRLGLSAVEQTVVGISARQVFASRDSADQEILHRLWDHSVITALAARRIAARIPGTGPEFAFLAGLLHDIGKPLILRAATLLRERDKTPRVDDATLFACFEELHCVIGESLLESWNVPAAIQVVVRHHHDSDLAASGEPLVAIIAFASRLANKLGSSLVADAGTPLLELQSATLLKLDDVRLASLTVDVEDDVQRARVALAA